MYITYQNKTCLPLSLLFDEEIVNDNNYGNWRKRGHLKVLRTGFDKTKTLIDAENMRADIKAKVIEIFGNPKDRYKIKLVDYIEWSKEAESFFRSYRYNENKSLPDNKILEYTTTVNILNAIDTLIHSVFAQRKVTKGKMWQNISKAVNNLSDDYNNCLPSNPTRLKARYKTFQSESFKSIIHKNYGNEFSVKLHSEGQRWALARWCNQVEKCANLTQLHQEYNVYAEQQSWKLIDEEKTFYNYIYDEEIQPLWWAHRYGEKAADEKFGYQHTRIQALRRDALWFSDGTKLNFYYQDENGSMQTAWVYEVMDAYSETLLGFHISKDTENFTHQYKAFKMAMQFSGHRPYEIKFDNQGGHKKLKAAKFFDKMSRIAVRTKPYNGKSKTIESAFGRFQQQIMKRCWFFTGQNVTAKKQESKTNMEFILANKKNLPTFEEAIEKYTEMREIWHQSKHFKTSLPRIEMYESSYNEKTPVIDTWDMVDMFWVWHSRGEKLQPITFTPGGLSFEVAKQSFEYMVYNDNGLPDMEFIDKSVDKKFYLKYDPEMMDEVYLYEKDHSGNHRYVTIAKLKVNIHGAAQDQTEGENSFIKKVDNAKDGHRATRFNAMETILEEHGVAAWQQGFNTPKIKGKHGKKTKKSTKTAEPVVVDHDKQISNLTQTDIYDW